MITRCSLALARWLCVMTVAAASPAIAQPVPLGGSPPAPPQQSTDDKIYPSVRLIYYAGREGRVWKEIERIDLTEWTLQKDVYLEYVWTEESKGIPRPIERGVERRFSVPQAPDRVWRVRYEAAATEGESRLFISGYGGRTGRTRIYGDDDFISFLYFADTGWYELGAEARLFRQVQLRSLNAVPATSPTRSQ